MTGFGSLKCTQRLDPRCNKLSPIEEKVTGFGLYREESISSRCKRLLYESECKKLSPIEEKVTGFGLYREEST